MEVLKKWKKSIIKRCKSTKEKSHGMATTNPNTLPKCKSWPQRRWSTSSPKQHLAPGGCFSVYVGSEKQRFVIKTKYANHPLFKELLEDAEQQYGYNSAGPLLLPCNVDLFYKVLAEMDCESTDIIRPYGCGGYAAYSLLSPSRLLKMN